MIRNVNLLSRIGQWSSIRCVESLGILSWERTNNIGSTCLKSKYVLETCNLLKIFLIFVCFFGNARPYQVSSGLECMKLRKIKDGTLRQEIVFSDILLVVSILHFFLVDFIDKLLDLVLIICRHMSWRSTSVRRYHCLNASSSILSYLFSTWSCSRSLTSNPVCRRWSLGWDHWLLRENVCCLLVGHKLIAEHCWKLRYLEVFAILSFHRLKCSHEVLIKLGGLNRILHPKAFVLNFLAVNRIIDGDWEILGFVKCSTWVDILN